MRSSFERAFISYAPAGIALGTRVISSFDLRDSLENVLDAKTPFSSEGVLESAPPSSARYHESAVVQSPRL
jgi:hypothetical protein